MSVLDGIRVLDLSWGFAGAMATLVLADYGADVIRVEPPGGDLLRAEPGFALWGRGKQSVVLDFGCDGERETARRLAETADVVVASFRPGRAERLGLAYGDIAPTNPRLVYASITGFGARGPLARLKGYEAIVMAKMGGLDHAGGMASRPGPAYPAVPFASFGAAHTALHGILAALYVRERTGRGQLVETSLVQGLAAYDPWEGFLRVICEKFPQGYTPTAPVSENGVPNTGFLFRLLVCLTRDGRWLQFSQTSPHLFREFIDALGLAWIWTHPRWAAAPDLESEADRSAFWDLLLCAAREKTLAEWQAVFAERPNVWAEIFRTTREAMDHPQMRHNGAVIRVDDPRHGPSEQLAPLVTMARTPARVRAPAPALGEHTGAVLAALDTMARAPAAPPAPAEASAPPLAGVTVLELGLFYAAPYGPALLADLGARVIKIEPLAGEPMRHIMPIPDAGAAKALQGKESVALDLATAEGRAIVHRLARRVDLVMVSYRGGVAAKLGVDYETLRRENPRLVYLSAPGYGVDGPCARKPAYAPTIGAAMGFARAQAGPGVPHGADLTLAEIRPASLRLGAAAQAPGNADGCSALGVATALLLGLLARERTGEGQEMRTSMLSTSAYAVSAECDTASGEAPHRTPDPLLFGLSALYRLYQTDDGWVFLACPRPHEWAPLCRALAADTALADDVRFATPAAREANDTALTATLADVFRRRGAAAWEALCLAHDVACAAVAPGPVAAQAMSHPLMRENAFLVDAEHPIYGTYRRLAPLVRLGAAASAPGPPCTLGQHTERVLGELGYDAAAIADLVRRQVVRTAT